MALAGRPRGCFSFLTSPAMTACVLYVCVPTSSLPLCGIVVAVVICTISHIVVRVPTGHLVDVGVRTHLVSGIRIVFPVVLGDQSRSLAAVGGRTSSNFAVDNRTIFVVNVDVRVGFFVAAGVRTGLRCPGQLHIHLSTYPDRPSGVCSCPYRLRSCL